MNTSWNCVSTQVQVSSEMDMQLSQSSQPPQRTPGARSMLGLSSPGSWPGCNLVSSPVCCNSCITSCWPCPLAACVSLLLCTSAFFLQTVFSFKILPYFFIYVIFKLSIYIPSICLFLVVSPLFFSNCYTHTLSHSTVNTWPLCHLCLFSICCGIMPSLDYILYEKHIEINIVCQESEEECDVDTILEGGQFTSSPSADLETIIHTFCTWQYQEDTQGGHQNQNTLLHGECTAQQQSYLQSYILYSAGGGREGCSGVLGSAALDKVKRMKANSKLAQLASFFLFIRSINY